MNCDMVPWHGDHAYVPVEVPGDCADIRIMPNELRRVVHSGHGNGTYVLGACDHGKVSLVAYYPNSVYGPGVPVAYDISGEWVKALAIPNPSVRAV